MGAGPTLARRHDADERTERALDYAIYALALVVVGLGLYGVQDMLFSATGAAGQDAPFATEVLRPIRAPFAGDNRIRVLLMGADKRPGDSGRSDTIMVLTMNPRTKRVAVLGIPRDIKWEIPGHGRDKINHSYAYGGIDLTRECIEDLIGARIDYHVLVQFHGFVKVVDELGGVWIEVPDVEGKGRGMNYDEKVRVMRTHIDHDGHMHLHLQPGYQKLDGAGALGFVRYRKSTMYHGAGDSDVARSARQQQFLRAMADQHLKVSNVGNLLEAAGEMRAHFTTDLAWTEIYDVLRVMKEVDTDALWTGTIPIEDDPDFFHGGIYYAYVLESPFRRLKAEMNRYLDGMPTELGDIEVLNASGIAGQAGRAAERLATKGFPVKTVGNADHFDEATTRIVYTGDHEEGARIAKNVLSCGVIAEADAESDEAPTDGHDIRVLLGQDFKDRDTDPS